GAPESSAHLNPLQVAKRTGVSQRQHQASAADPTRAVGIAPAGAGSATALAPVGGEPPTALPASRPGRWRRWVGLVAAVLGLAALGMARLFRKGTPPGPPRPPRAVIPLVS